MWRDGKGSLETTDLLKHQNYPEFCEFATSHYSSVTNGIKVMSGQLFVKMVCALLYHLSLGW